MKCDCEMIFTGNGRKKRDAARTGYSILDEYKIWAGMRSRCNPKTKMGSNKYYTGIKISKSWAESFENFFSDMGKRRNKEFSIDRKDGSLGYCKHNCKWATKFEQVMNRCNTKKKNLPLGVSKNNSGRYSVRIRVLGRDLHLGTFLTKREAVSEYERFSKYFSKPDTELL